jgi:[ribosomal protein S5]-alanine N-acetyltransferase
MYAITLTTTISTDRLLLVPVTDKYKYKINSEFTPEITRFMPFNPKGDISVTESFIKRSAEELAAGQGVQFCVLKKDTNEFMGCCGLHHTDTKTIEIGLWIKKSAQRNGYGTETVKALINFVENNFVIDYLFYPVDKENWPSRKIPEKLGFSTELTYDKKKSEFEILNIIEFRRYTKVPGKDESMR